METHATMTPEQIRQEFGVEVPADLMGMGKRRTATVTLAGCEGPSAPATLTVTCPPFLVERFRDWVQAEADRNAWGGVVTVRGAYR